VCYAAGALFFTPWEVDEIQVKQLTCQKFKLPGRLPPSYIHVLTSYVDVFPAAWLQCVDDEEQDAFWWDEKSYQFGALEYDDMSLPQKKSYDLVKAVRQHRQHCNACGSFLALRRCERICTNALLESARDAAADAPMPDLVKGGEATHDANHTTDRVDAATVAKTTATANHVNKDTPARLAGRCQG
jgi:hypothetical protein